MTEYKCVECNQTFTTKRWLEYHTKKNICKNKNIHVSYVGNLFQKYSLDQCDLVNNNF